MCSNVDFWFHGSYLPSVFKQNVDFGNQQSFCILRFEFFWELKFGRIFFTRGHNTNITHLRHIWAFKGFLIDAILFFLWNTLFFLKRFVGHKWQSSLILKSYSIIETKFNFGIATLFLNLYTSKNSQNIHTKFRQNF